MSFRNIYLDHYLGLAHTAYYFQVVYNHQNGVINLDVSKVLLREYLT